MLENVKIFMLQIVKGVLLFSLLIDGWVIWQSCMDDEPGNFIFALLGILATVPAVRWIDGKLFNSNPIIED